MNSIFSSIIIALCSTTALATTGLEIVKPVEGHPNQCFVKDTKTFYNINESWKLKECGIGSCNSMNIRGKQQFIISYTGCGVVQAEAPCYVSENKDLTYPDCCPDVVCPDFEETEQNGNGISDDENQDSGNLDSFELREENPSDEEDLYGFKSLMNKRLYQMY